MLLLNIKPCPRLLRSVLNIGLLSPVVSPEKAGYNANNLRRLRSDLRFALIPLWHHRQETDRAQPRPGTLLPQPVQLLRYTAHLYACAPEDADAQKSPSRTLTVRIVQAPSGSGQSSRLSIQHEQETNLPTARSQHHEILAAEIGVSFCPWDVAGSYAAKRATLPSMCFHRSRDTVLDMLLIRTRYPAPQHAQRGRSIPTRGSVVKPNLHGTGAEELLGRCAL